MAKKFKIEIEGLEEAKKLLKTIPQKISDKALYDINRAAANKIVKPELQAYAPTTDSNRTHKIRDSIRVVKGKSKHGVSSVLTGWLREAFHIIFFVKGTRIRKTDDGKNRGSMDRTDFVTPAHRSSSWKVVDFFKANYLELMNKSLRSQLKKINKK